MVAVTSVVRPISLGYCDTLLHGYHAYSYEVKEIELHPGQNGRVPSSDDRLPRNESSSISAAKLLKGIEKSYDFGKKLLDASENTNNQAGKTSGEAKRGQAEELSEKFNTPIRIVENLEELKHDNPEVQKRMREGKGFYDTETGEVVVVVPNNATVEDVAETVFHAEINSVSGLFPKDDIEWIKGIQEGRAIYLDKEKVQTIIDSQRTTNTVESERIGLNLNSVANIVKSFENPQNNINETRFSFRKAESYKKTPTEVDGMARAAGRVPL